MNFIKSQCKGTWLHKYALISVHQEAVEERCTRCGHRQITRLYRGNPNAVGYAETHLREFLIPQHRLFRKEYPLHA